MGQGPASYLVPSPCIRTDILCSLDLRLLCVDFLIATYRFKVPGHSLHILHRGGENTLLLGHFFIDIGSDPQLLHCQKLVSFPLAGTTLVSFFWLSFILSGL